MKIKLSKSQWEFLGKKAGWLRVGQGNDGFLDDVDPAVLRKYLEEKMALEKRKEKKDGEELWRMGYPEICAAYENELTKMLGRRPTIGLQISQEQADKIKEIQGRFETINPSFDFEENIVFQKRPDGTIVLAPGSCY